MQVDVKGRTKLGKTEREKNNNEQKKVEVSQGENEQLEKVRAETALKMERKLTGEKGKKTGGGS